MSEKRSQKWPYIGRRFFLNQKFYTNKFCLKTRVSNVFTKKYIKKLVFLKILLIKLFLLIKKYTF